MSVKAQGTGHGAQGIEGKVGGWQLAVRRRSPKSEVVRVLIEN